MKVWVTRSQPGAGRLAMALQDAGHEPELSPVFSIERLDVRVDGPVSMCIVLSGHAASAASQVKPAYGFLAIGRSTAQAVTEATGQPVVIPDGADSEGIVRWLQQHPVDPAAGSVVILSGEGGREVVEDHLRKCGVAYIRVDAYRRRIRQVDPAPDGVEAIEIASLEALNQVRSLWQSGGGSLDIPMLVVSDRLAQAARAMGFTDVRVCAGPEPSAMVVALNRKNPGVSANREYR